jgi:hypothetical protein
MGRPSRANRWLQRRLDQKREKKKSRSKTATTLGVAVRTQRGGD